MGDFETVIFRLKARFRDRSLARTGLPQRSSLDFANGKADSYTMLPVSNIVSVGYDYRRM